MARKQSAEQLVDVRNVGIDVALPSETRMAKMGRQLGSPNKFRVGNVAVECTYSGAISVEKALARHMSEHHAPATMPSGSGSS